MKNDAAIRDYSLYILKLEHGKYYVGTTSQNPYVRIKEHGSYKGATWTRLHKPVKTLQIKKLGLMTRAHAQEIEHEVTLRYMKKYRYKNVRGGYVNYPGFIFPLTKRRFMNGWQVEMASTSLLLLTMSAYLFLHRH